MTRFHRALLGALGRVHRRGQIVHFPSQSSGEPLDLGRLDQPAAAAELAIQDGDLHSGRIGDLLDAHCSLAIRVDCVDRRFHQAVSSCRPARRRCVRGRGAGQSGVHRFHWSTRFQNPVSGTRRVLTSAERFFILLTMLESPIRDRRSERREATIAEILDAAWKLVRTEGLAGLVMRDLASRVGMQAPSLYSYFGSKHAIYDAMFAQGARAYLEEEALVPSTGDPLADLQAGVRFFVSFCTKDPVRYQLMFQRTIPGFEPSPESYALALEFFAIGEQMLAAVGVTDPDGADLFTGIVAGFAAQQVANDPGGDRWVRQSRRAIEMFLADVDRHTKSRKASR